jgi:hypothetical protein
VTYAVIIIFALLVAAVFRAHKSAIDNLEERLEALERQVGIKVSSKLR